MNIAIFLSRIPWPLDKGDKLRAFYQIKELSKNHNITLIALSNSKDESKAYAELSKYCENIHFLYIPKFRRVVNVIKSFFNGKPFQVGYFTDIKSQNEIQEILSKIKIEVGIFQLIRMAEYSRKTNFPKIIDYQDALSVGLFRRYKTAKGIVKLALINEANRMKKYENMVFDWFDQHTIITKTDRDLIPHPLKNRIKIIPNGVDTIRFSTKNIIKKYDIIFAGNMNYPPNIDASNYLVDEIMPLVWAQFPNTNLILAGANPNKTVQQKASEKVIISGWIDDISEAYDQARIFVAPMRIGTGLQNKLLEAMAIQLPCVTTNLANDALGAIENKQILVGNSALEISQQINKLMQNSSLYTKIATEGNKFVNEQYSWESVGVKLENLLLELKR